MELGEVKKNQPLWIDSFLLYRERKRSKLILRFLTTRINNRWISPKLTSLLLGSSLIFDMNTFL